MVILTTHHCLKLKSCYDAMRCTALRVVCKEHSVAVWLHKKVLNDRQQIKPVKQNDWMCSNIKF